VLLYRASTREEIVFRDELTALAQERRARVIFLLGRDRELLSSTSLCRLVPNLADRDVYLCGSPGMASTVRASLAGAGLPPGRLHEERFAF
jgi:ferredoxin-NADP reductase